MEKVKVVIFKDNYKLKEYCKLSDEDICKIENIIINDNYEVYFLNDNGITQVERTKNLGKECYVVLHKTKIDEFESDGLGDKYKNDFDNVLIQSHTDSFYKETIPRILLGECTLDEIKEYFNSKTELDYKKIEEKYLKGIEITDKDLKNLNC